MKKTIAVLMGLFCGATSFSYAESAPPPPPPSNSSWIAGIRAGSTGVEVEGGYVFNDTLKIRTGVSGLTHVRRSLKVGDLKAENLDLRLLFAKISLDWHFLKNGFRLSGGLAFNGSKIKFEKNLNGVTIGGVPFQPGDRAFANYKYRVLAPFIGIGYDSPNLGNTPLSLTVEVGYLFLGKPTASARVDSPGLAPFIGADRLNSEAKAYFNQLPEDHKWLKTFPHISVGLKCTF